MSQETPATDIDVDMNLLEEYKKLYGPTDYNLKCHGREFPVHKGVVRYQSSFFRTACPEGTKKPATKGPLDTVDEFEDEFEMVDKLEDEFDMVDDDPVMVDRLVRFMYCEYYTDEPYTSPDGHRVSSSQIHARMFALGKKYGVDLLDDEAIRRMRELWEFDEDKLDETFSSVPDIFNLTTPHTNKRLRKWAIRFVVGRLERILDDETAMSTFDDLCRQVPDFATGLLRLYAKQTKYFNSMFPEELLSQL